MSVYLKKAANNPLVGGQGIKMIGVTRLGPGCNFIPGFRCGLRCCCGFVIR